MTDNWTPDVTPKERPLGAWGWVRALLRLLGIASVIYALIPVLLLARLIEKLVKRRFVSDYVVQLACKTTLVILGLGVTVRGRAMKRSGALVSNHCSWLDIFSLNAAAHVAFVSKSEISSWPVIGFISRVAGTIFIERRSSQAKRQNSQFKECLLAGERLLFFPEGTSTDSRHVMQFKSTLFAAFFEPDLAETMWIQPTTLVYEAPKGEDSWFYGWWGEMEFAPHFLKTLGVRRSGAVTVIFHEPVRVSDFKDRKALARHCEAKVKGALLAEIAPR